MKKKFAFTPLRISIIVALITVAAYIGGFPFFETMELKSLDLRFRMRGEKAPGDEVAIVTIDEKSLDELGRWPWPRTRIAELINELTDYGVRNIGFDVNFAEPDHNAPASALKEVRKKMGQLKVRNRRLEAYLDEKVREGDNDAILESAIHASKRVILGYFFHANDGETDHSGKSVVDQLSLMKGESFSSILYTSKEAQSLSFAPSAVAVESNLDRFTKAAAGTGYFNVFPDSDGTVRWVPLIMAYGGSYFPPLSLRLAAAYLDNSQLALTVNELGVETLKLGHIEIPVNEAGQILVNYRGEEKNFPHYSVSDVLKRKVPPQKLKDRIVLVGATAIGIYDMRVTPFSGVFPGVEIHANVIDNILRQEFLFRPDWIKGLDLLMIVASALILGIVIPWTGPIRGALLFLAIFTGFIWGNYHLFAVDGVWLNFVYPAFAMLTCYSSITLFHYMTEERERKKVKNAFQYYMTSSVVQEVLKDPEKLKLGGDKKVLSVLFSDIRSFTTMSEKMSPEGLVNFLNEYLTVMTDIVFENDGVLDKYMGDAIMAIYGAPMEQKDHPLRACMTALQMMRGLKELHRSWREKGLPEMDIGIGIATGPMVVGNMGSQRRFDYTVMGDTVNLGSRLEGINKVYGTNIIISEDTYEAVREKLVCRELDAVRVKGKERPVKIYELMAERGRDERYEKLAFLFESALSMYRDLRWSDAMDGFQSVLKIRQGDRASLLYIERCRALSVSPPPQGWDGVFTMKTK